MLTYFQILLITFGGDEYFGYIYASVKFQEAEPDGKKK
jgi:hypothetical protein